MRMHFLYRIDSGYDGFLPCHITGRVHQQCISYNWYAYAQLVEPGDIVYTYFTGPGCHKGIFAVATIVSVKLGVRDGNVVGRLLSYSPDNRRPLVDAAKNARLFRLLNCRRRGAEVIVPQPIARRINRLLNNNSATDAHPVRADTRILRSMPNRSLSLRDVPMVSRKHLSETLRKKSVLAVYWIRPTQATWMVNIPKWLHKITRIFHEFKAGDLSRLDGLALALARRGIIQASKANRIGVVLSVPLNAQKRLRGEVDRVGELAKRVSTIVGVPYSRGLRLRGRVSRRLYKKRCASDFQFQKRYRHNLRICRTSELINCVESDRDILLIDDVYTDGVTTATIADSLRSEFGCAARVRIATLGIMAKARNMNKKLASAWR